jgi:hypothetical protein
LNYGLKKLLKLAGTSFNCAWKAIITIQYSTELSKDSWSKEEIPLAQAKEEQVSMGHPLSMSITQG